MGLFTSQIRLIFLTLYKDDLEYKMQLLSQTKLQILNSSNELVSVGSDLDPDSPEMRLLEQRRQRLELVNKKLDSQLETYKTQLAAVDAETQAVTKMVEKNIQSFNYYRGGG